MIAIIFYINAIVGVLSCIALAIAGLPIASFILCVYAIMCILIGTSALCISVAAELLG